MKQEALYPFGYGLSYTEFLLDHTCISTDVISKEGITIETDLSNTGGCDGAQTIQVYVKVEQPNTSNAQLKGVKKVFLRRGEKKHITLHLKEEDFGLYQNRFSEISENGSYRIWQLPFRSLVRFFV